MTGDCGTECSELMDANQTIHILAKTLGDKNRKLKAIENTLIDVCVNYGTDFCREGCCDTDPNGWEGCLTRKILGIINHNSEGLAT